MKHNQPIYNPVLADLYKRAKREYTSAQQWKEYPTIDSAAFYLTHLTKALALVELLESVTVFNVGGGYYQKFCSDIKTRLDSFQQFSD